MTGKIIIDTDPGIDDTIAISSALRSPEIEVVGLTTIFGNAPCPITTQNALRLVELEGNGHIPVAKGSDHPLTHFNDEFGTMVHGKDGFGNTNLPAPKGEAINQPAALFIIEMVHKHPGEITLVALGPLTNLALALRLEPELPQLVKGVIIMGGTVRAPGNISPVAEANIYNDAHAADLVMSAGWPLTMVGLDVTTKTIITTEWLKRLYQVDNPAVRLIEKMMPCYFDFYEKTEGKKDIVPTHDPSAIAYLLRPDLYTTSQAPVYIATEGLCRGQVNTDRKKQWGKRAPIAMCLDVDADGVLALLYERLTK